MARLTLVQKRGKVRLEFSDREQVWVALFVVDVVLWVVKRPAFGQLMDVALRGVHQWLFRAVAHL